MKNENKKVNTCDERRGTGPYTTEVGRLLYLLERLKKVPTVSFVS